MSDPSTDESSADEFCSSAFVSNVAEFTAFFEGICFRADGVKIEALLRHHNRYLAKAGACPTIETIAKYQKNRDGSYGAIETKSDNGHYYQTRAILSR